ncbi:Translation machinery-associated protein 22 [Wickerhamomyces ciferrii]|uniref:Translation machinery-associated protein 22 n=1 Tax=Wickerhamomyces ciferrii (strain ATCC 14091 / BCRC 22168 / CBS 111 / JCM 3599 / NBRC 0793 / NRRL Y-1031 F-60-10) TaxID=1206466 RepID=K0KSL5_WICCF|nr:Translation machinery-associated protein 22 [Wickerhamomyces ciferrii]CCH45037.1 Translation machinery-associated protein 22 [Wickerhamomyces ciferrii]
MAEVDYCEFGASVKKCKAWLEDENEELYNKLYSEDALVNATSTLSLEKQEKLDKELQKKQAKEEAKQERELQKKLSSKVVLKRIERTKRKHAIQVSGLEIFEIDMKKLAKTFASKFATGCSVTKTVEKKEEIIVQGDVGDEVERYITGLLKEKGLTDIKVEQIEEKKKKKAPPAIPPQ